MPPKTIKKHQKKTACKILLLSNLASGHEATSSILNNGSTGKEVYYAELYFG